MHEGKKLSTLQAISTVVQKIIMTHRNEVIKCDQPRPVFYSSIFIWTSGTTMNSDVVLRKLFVGNYTFKELVHIPWL
jgi:hypothetical protein